MSLFAFLSASGPPTRLGVGEALADDARQERIGAVGVVVAERNAVAVPEIEFGKVTVQMDGSKNWVLSAFQPDRARQGMT